MGYGFGCSRKSPTDAADDADHPDRAGGGIAFRCGLFNIGGQGQYLVGLYVAVWIGSSFAWLSPSARDVLPRSWARSQAGLRGYRRVLKATVGAHEVITTIMLNWISVWVGSYLLRRRSADRGSSQDSIPVSNDIDGGQAPVFWGVRLLQGLDRDLRRTCDARGLLGDHQSNDPRIRRARGRVQPRSGALRRRIRSHGTPLSRWRSRDLAGLAGALDVTGWEFRIGPSDITVSTIGFIGIAAALLGRSTAIGVGAASLLFGALINGTASRHLDPTVFRPELATNLATIIQGLVILFVGLNLAGLWAWLTRRRST